MSTITVGWTSVAGTVGDQVGRTDTDTGFGRAPDGIGMLRSTTSPSRRISGGWRAMRESAWWKSIVGVGGDGVCALSVAGGGTVRVSMKSFACSRSSPGSGALRCGIGPPPEGNEPSSWLTAACSASSLVGMPTYAPRSSWVSPSGQSVGVVAARFE